MRIRVDIKDNTIRAGTEGQQLGRARSLCASDFAHAIFFILDTGDFRG